MGYAKAKKKSVGTTEYLDVFPNEKYEYYRMGGGNGKFIPP